MTGDPAFLPVIADCERALGRPERALKIAQDPAVNGLDTANRTEMLIVAAGARIDLGQAEAAVLYLEPYAKRSRSRTIPATRLRYAYADALLAAGREDDALEWFHRAASSDHEGLTDAAARAALGTQRADGGREVLCVQRAGGGVVGALAAGRVSPLAGGTRFPPEQNGDWVAALRGAALSRVAAASDVVPGAADVRGGPSGAVAGGKIRR